MPSCGHITQSVQHVVIDCNIYKAPDGFAGLRCSDAATRSWLEDLNIDILRNCKRLYRKTAALNLIELSFISTT